MQKQTKQSQRREASTLFTTNRAFYESFKKKDTFLLAMKAE